MPRIPQEQIERLKSQVKVSELCREYGIELKATGSDNLMGRCPFHDDHDPSFGVTPSKNLWNCLGGCGGGDAIQLVMRMEKVSFRHAAEKLQERLGLIPPAAAVIQTRKGIAHPALVEAECSDAELLGHVMAFYHQSFCNDPRAMRYLRDRRCFHPEAVKVFQIGYANRTLGYRVPTSTAAGRRLQEQLQHLGILRASGHEHLCGSVVFPILDASGEVKQMYGRKITPRLREGTPLHLYLPMEHSVVWNAGGLPKAGEWLLCESILDALTLWCAGFRNVTCAYGVNGFTASHWALLEELQPRRMVLCHDPDEAGDTAAAKLAPQLRERGIEVFRARLPAGRDINEVARSTRPGGEARALAAVLEGAEAGAPGGTSVCVPIAIPATISSCLAAPPAAATVQAAKGKEPAPAAPSASSLAAVSGPSGAGAGEPPPPREPAAEAAPAIGREGEVLFAFGPRQWRARGIEKNLSFETLRVQLRVMVQDRYHLDTLDLCNAKHRQGFVAQARAETNLDEQILKHDLGQVLLKVEELQEQMIRQSLKPQKQEIPISDAEREAALGLLKDPRLLERILEDFEGCGVVGEATNKLVGYLAAVSRKLEEPLAVIIQSTSAAGKSSLMEAILAFIPPEERIKYSAMTGQSLYYLGDCNLKHKVLAIVEEEGASRASYALKLLQSEGELTIASTGKDPATGRMVTQEYHVEGPVMIMLTTTAIDIDEELLNRCIILSVDESRDQTRAIHVLQRERETVEGMLLKLRKEATLKLHRNAQRLLHPVKVVNPFARQLTFLDDRTRTRRDHMKYLGLIRALALLHQHQRPLKMAGGTSYIEATLEDIATANRLAGEALGRSLDELPPQTRRLLSLIHAWVQEECRRQNLLRRDLRFSRREVRQATGWTDFQVRVHLDRLTELEYVLVHRGSRGQSFVYELLYDGQGRDGAPFLAGLIDVAHLSGPTYDAKFEGGKPEVRGAARAVRAPIEPPTRGH